jgi:ribosome-binding protein aMBF1 (putative translation factor)
MILLGHRLTFARQNAGLSIGQAAALLGTKPRFIKDCEADKFDIAEDRYLAEEFAELYEVSLAWLCTGTAKDLSEWAPQLEKLKEPARTKVTKLLESMP